MAIVRCSTEFLAALVFKHHPTEVTVLDASTDEVTGDIMIRVDGAGIPETNDEVGYWVSKEENWAGDATYVGRFEE